MTCELVQDLLPDKAARRLGADQDRVVSEHLRTCPRCTAELATLQSTLDALDAMPLPTPSRQVRARVLASIEAEKHAVRAALPRQQPRGALFWLVRIAGASALVAAGFVLGVRQAKPAAPAAGEPTTQQQIAALQARVDSMTQLVGYTLSKGSTNDRIARVLTTAAVMKPDDRAIDNLIAAMTLDSSAMVRLNAVEALYAHSSSPVVRAAVVASITREPSALVQVALIDFAVAAHDREAAPLLQQLALSEQTDPNVREAAKRALIQL